MSSTHTYRALTEKRPLERLLETARHDSAPPSTLSMQCKLLMPTRQPSETALAQTLSKSCAILASGAYGWQPARQCAASQIPPATSNHETAWIFHKTRLPEKAGLAYRLSEKEGSPHGYAALRATWPTDGAAPCPAGSNPCARQQKARLPKGTGLVYHLAEEEGFEPSYPGLPDKRFSRPPHSTTLPPLRVG